MTRIVRSARQPIEHYKVLLEENPKWLGDQARDILEHYITLEAKLKTEIESRDGWRDAWTKSEAKLEAMERLLLPVLWTSRKLYAATPHSLIPSALQYTVWELALMEVASFYPDIAVQEEQGE